MTTAILFAFAAYDFSPAPSATHLTSHLAAEPTVTSQGDSNIRTNEVSAWSGKGMHTTTFAEMHDLPIGGKIIDTPGMREFAIADIERSELSHYFPEMRILLNDCQYNNCMHINEPSCAVKNAVINGQISEDRYISYCTILDSIKENDWD